jgi:3'(2'), 5'-bisphosphate nucleotidase
MALSDWKHELSLACAAARAGGAAVMEFYGDTSYQSKTGGSPVTAADDASNTAVLQLIRDAFPNDAILSEESRDSAARLSANRLWIIDPLDGTKEFIARIPEFAVMIALLNNSRLVVAAVYRPVDDALYFASVDGGAFRAQHGATAQLRVDPHRRPIRAVGSRSHAEPTVSRLYDALGATVEPCGSVGVKCALIAEGQRDLYVHPVPYMSEWDTAAPELILREAGGVVTDCTGAALCYNKQDPHQPRGILAAASHELHENVIGKLRAQPAVELPR